MIFFKTLKKNTMILVIVTFISIYALLIVNHFLAKRIDQASDNYLKQTIAELGQYFPPASYNNDLSKACYTPKNQEIFGDDPVIEKVLLPQLDHKIVGYIIIGSTYKGYSGRIQTMLVTNPQGTIRAVRVLQQLETPGLGTKIVTTNWVHEFDNITLQNAKLPQLAVKKDGGDIDQFTGATITPRAVTNQVRLSMQKVVKQLVTNTQQTLANDFVTCPVGKGN